MKLTQYELKILEDCVSEKIERFESMIEKKGNSAILRTIAKKLTLLDEFEAKIKMEKEKIA